MKFSVAAAHALHALVYLARHQGRGLVPAEEIARGSRSGAPPAGAAHDRPRTALRHRYPAKASIRPCTSNECTGGPRIGLYPARRGRGAWRHFAASWGTPGAFPAIRTGSLGPRGGAVSGGGTRHGRQNAILHLNLGCGKLEPSSLGLVRLTSARDRRRSPCGSGRWTVPRGWGARS